MFEISNITKYFANFCFSFSVSSQSNILYCPKFLTKNIHTASHSYCSCCLILLLFILLHTPTVHTASYSYCLSCLILLLFMLPHTPTVHPASCSYCSCCLILLLSILPVLLLSILPVLLLNWNKICCIDHFLRQFCPVIGHQARRVPSFSQSFKIRFFFSEQKRLY